MRIGILCCPRDLKKAGAIQASLASMGIECIAFPDPRAGTGNADAAAAVFDATIAATFIVLSPDFVDFIEKSAPLREGLYQLTHQPGRVRVLEVEPIADSALPFYLAGLRRFLIEPADLKVTLDGLVESLKATGDAELVGASKLNYRTLLSDIEPTRTIAEPIDVRDPTSRQLMFQLYKLEGNANKNDRTYFICFPATRPSIAEAGRIFRERFSSITDGAITALLQRPRRSAKGKESDLRNVETEFGLPKASCFYVNDFLRQNSPAFTRSRTDGARSPVLYVALPCRVTRAERTPEPVATHDDALHLIEEYCDEHESLIHIVVAPGGRGKTQLARALAYRLQQTDRWPVLLSSDQYLNAMEASDGDLDSDHLYRLFQASGPNASGVTSGEFRQQWDQGNIILIIDGLDEIATKAPSTFDFAKLREAVDRYAEVGSGRIIITTRALFWDAKSADVTSNYTIIELEPFDRDRAERFFRESFRREYPSHSTEGVVTLVAVAVRTAEQFFGDSLIQAERFVYVPYVLDLICQQMIKEAATRSDRVSILPDVSEARKLTSRTHVGFTDFVVDTICGRESLRMGARAVDTDDQRRIFLALAESGDVGVSESSFREICRSVLRERFNEEVGRFLLAHTLLQLTNANRATGNILHFRYDFLVQHFQVRCLEEAIKTNALLSRPLVEILAKECRFDSEFLRQLASTFKDDSVDTLILQLLDSIAGLRGELRAPDATGAGRVHAFRGAISGLFCLALQREYLEKDARVLTDRVDRICHELFGRTDPDGQKILDGLYLDGVDRAVTAARRIQLDFSDKIITRSSFSRFGSFWESKVTDGTRFTECEFSDLGQPRGQSELRQRHFDASCRTDQEFRDVLESYEDASTSLREDCRRKIQRLFRRFLREVGLGRNRFRSEAFPQLRLKNMSFDSLVAILTNHGFITYEADSTRGHFDIAAERLEDVRHLCEQNIVTARMEKLVEQIALSVERRI